MTTVLNRLLALADVTRSRLTFALDGHELTVGELCTALQLPQSTVSRQLKLLVDEGWLLSRAEGTSRYYRLSPHLGSSARDVWAIVRQDVSEMAITQEDAQRVTAVLRNRRSTSRAFFSAAATRWDAVRRELYGERTDLSSLLAILEPTWRVGDLGCGTGHLAELLSPHVEHIIAVDGSSEMRAAARTRLEGASNVEVREGDLESLPIADEVLDIAFLNLVLHYVAEPPMVLREAWRVLRTGGVLAVIDMLPHGREEYRTEMGHIWRGFTGDDVAQWMLGVGFADVRWVNLTVEERAKGPVLFMARGRKTTALDITDTPSTQ